MTKKKIINDPLYGFIPISNEFIFELLNHPHIQRLRYIRQLGMSDLVYPGALHTRFHHAIGAMHLMSLVLDALRSKGVDINAAEYEAAQIAMLLHDVGHGPLSHTLEETILTEVDHENLSYLFMKAFNHQYNGALDLTMQLFRGTYHRPFFHQLISSQIDVDRLDYLRRDSYFTGVPEGMFGVDRMITRMEVMNDELVIDEKGLQNIESFLYARRYMYWQVYLHKTVIAAERMICNTFKRAQYLMLGGDDLPCTDALKVFLTKNYTVEDFSNQISLLETFGNLDDHDLWGAIKLWRNHADTILSGLCTRLLQRNLFHIELTESPIQKSKVEKLRHAIHNNFGILLKDTQYLFSTGYVSNEAFASEGKPVHILTKSGLQNIGQAAEFPTIKAISKVVRKNYICWPKSISLN